MSKFLKLTNFCLNKSLIHTIQMEETKIIIRVINPDFFGFQIFSSGTLSNNSYYYTFCSEKTPKDFQIIKDWVDKIK